MFFLFNDKNSSIYVLYHGDQNFFFYLQIKNFDSKRSFSNLSKSTISVHTSYVPGEDTTKSGSEVYTADQKAVGRQSLYEHKLDMIKP